MIGARKVYRAAFVGKLMGNLQARGFSASFNPVNMAEEILRGDRIALSKAITLTESSREDHRQRAIDLLTILLPNVQRDRPTLRIGIAGPPGAGKSSFIEALGMYLVENTDQINLSVLAIDPSSSVTGGSLLGDKTRMTDLSQSPRVYIRPSPSRGTLGGIARHSNEAVLLCECAGFNLTFIETVGLGQSEIAIADVCDMILLLVPPAGGDELQGLKKGIIEIADMIIVNKADGALISSANHSVAEYRRALQLVRPSFPGVWSPKVLPCSTKERNGFEEIWKNVQDFEKAIRSTGILEKKRMHQRKKLLWSEVQAQLVSIVRNDPRLTEVIRESEFYSQENKISPRSGAYRIIQSFLNHISQHNS